jgi:SAM-dependent methyltransferase
MSGATLRGLLGLCAALGLGCPGTMHEVDGRRVFNPLYRFFLDTPERERWQMPGEVLRALALPAGAAVADVGAGTGYFSVRLAAAVGAGGRVYATDVQDEMLRALERRVARERLANVTVVRAGFDDPALPDACCDLVLLANVYKEIDQRPAYLRRLARALRDGGRIAIIEFRPGSRGPGPPEDARLAEERVVAELGEAGFVLAERHDFLPRQYFLVFARPPEAQLSGSSSPSVATREPPPPPMRKTR